jgi:3-oxoacyl-(acyl-carrier-protein) synthase
MTPAHAFRGLHLAGGAWATSSEYGAFRSGNRARAPAPRTLRDLVAHAGLGGVELKSSDRLTADCIDLCFVAALALADARAEAGSWAVRDVGVVATDPGGCVEANERFFRDYVEAGRELARASLFIYTLPTSPAAEAAIRLGLQGPTLYVGAPTRRIAVALETAGRVLRGGQARGMIVTGRDGDDTVAFAVEPAHGGRTAHLSRETLLAAAPAGDIAALVETAFPT